MKRPLVLFLLIAVAVVALVGGAWLGPRVVSDPGYVLIEVGGWRIQMSFVVLVGAVLGAWAAISIALMLIRLPGRAVRRARDVRDRRNLDRGLLALSEGDWAQAERCLTKAMSGRGGTTSGYLAAARAAQGQSAPQRRDEYLALADTRFGKRHFATMLVRARLLAGEGDTAGAVDLLEQLHLKRPRHEGVLKLLLECYQREDRWHDVRMLIPSLRKAGIIDGERADELGQLAAAREIETASDVEELQRVHGRIKRSQRNAPAVAAAFARRALELDQPALSEPLLRHAIEQEFDDDLLALYAQTDPGDRRTRIDHCERWLKAGRDDAALHFALGRLYLEEREDDKAREHLEIAVRSSPDPSAYAALAQVLDRAGLLEPAAQCYRNALRLEQGRAPEPLPPGRDHDA